MVRLEERSVYMRTWILNYPNGGVTTDRGNTTATNDFHISLVLK